jgi:hypothetical protein
MPRSRYSVDIDSNDQARHDAVASDRSQMG